VLEKFQKGKSGVGPGVYTWKKKRTFESETTGIGKRFGSIFNWRRLTKGVKTVTKGGKTPVQFPPRFGGLK